MASDAVSSPRHVGLVASGAVFDGGDAKGDEGWALYGAATTARLRAPLSRDRQEGSSSECP